MVLPNKPAAMPCNIYFAVTTCIILSYTNMAARISNVPATSVVSKIVFVEEKYLILTEEDNINQFLNYFIMSI